jgi:hypothetical protein
LRFGDEGVVGSWIAIFVLRRFGPNRDSGLSN